MNDKIDIQTGADTSTATKRTANASCIACAVGIAVLIVVSFMAVGCSSSGDQQLIDDIQAGDEVQGRVMNLAIESVPAYEPSEFALRKNINWRLEDTEHPADWYVYAMNMMGEPMFYIASSIKPMNVCISISPPDRIEVVDIPHATDQAVVMTAPALNGVYYGGAACNSYYVRDAVTGNQIELSGDTFTLIASKVPINIETDRLRLENNTNNSGKGRPGS